MTARAILAVEVIDDTDGAKVEITRDNEGDDERPWLLEATAAHDVDPSVKLFLATADLRGLADAIGELLDREVTP